MTFGSTPKNSNMYHGLSLRVDTIVPVSYWPRVHPSGKTDSHRHTKEREGLIRPLIREHACPSQKSLSVLRNPLPWTSAKPAYFLSYSKSMTFLFLLFFQNLGMISWHTGFVFLPLKLPALHGAAYKCLVFFVSLLLLQLSLLGLSVSCLPEDEPLCWLTASCYDTLPHNSEPEESLARDCYNEAKSIILPWICCSSFGHTDKAWD